MLLLYSCSRRIIMCRLYFFSTTLNFQERVYGDQKESRYSKLINNNISSMMSSHKKSFENDSASYIAVASSRPLVYVWQLVTYLWKHGVPGQGCDLINHQLEVIRDERLDLLHRVLDEEQKGS